jgi:hypothetical protein
MRTTTPLTLGTADEIRPFALITNGRLVRAERWCAALLLVLLTAVPANAALVIDEFSFFRDHAQDGSDAGDTVTFDQVHLASIPFSHSQEAIDEGSSAASENQIFTFGDTTVIRIDFDHVRSGQTLSMTQSSGQILFTIDEPLDYDLRGFFAAATSTPTFNEYSLRAQLSGVSDILFESVQVSGNLVNVELTLGESNGNFTNVLEGSPMGSLPAGTYGLTYSAHLREFNSVVSANEATGAGYFEFRFGNLAIPEPGAAFLLSMGTAGIALRRRR